MAVALEDEPDAPAPAAPNAEVDARVEDLRAEAQSTAPFSARVCSAPSLSPMS